jgi:threonine/homoserine/homoserine lactone efflux protein
VTAFLVALVPSIGVLFIFWIGIRALVQADRRERAAQARIEAEERLRNRTTTAGGPDSTASNTGPAANNLDA